MTVRSILRVQSIAAATWGCALTALLVPVPATAAPLPLPNAWQMTDNSAADGSTMGYTNVLSASYHVAATNSGFSLTVNARMVTNFSAVTRTMNVSYNLGARRFLVWWHLNSNGALTAELEGGATYTLTANGVGGALYHTHEIRYNTNNGRASYLFDGVAMTTNWQSSSTPESAGQIPGRIRWGAGSEPGRGQINYHSVNFSIYGLGTVASYDAGMDGNPATAPDPTTQGWTLTPATPPSNTGVSHVSPDTALLSFLPTSIPGLPGVNNSAVAWGDYDNDGRLDFLVTGSGYSSTGAVAQLWRNTGDSFTNVPVPGLLSGYDSAAAWGDYDNDGRLDFLVTSSSPLVSHLWRSTGSGFNNVTAGSAAGLPQAGPGSVAWGDYDNDGRLDFLITGNSSAGFVAQLWRNMGSGFSDVTKSVAPDVRGVFHGSVAWGDYDNDGRLDFLLTGSTNFPGGGLISQLWRNTGSGFANVTAEVAPGLPGVFVGAVAWGDYDNDGRLDFLITGSTNYPGNGVAQLWRNTGGGFSNVTAYVAPGLPGVDNSTAAWGDFDNDGRLDFLITGGSSTGVVSQLWRNTGGGFSNVTASVAPGLPGVIEGFTAWGDYDNDGRLDFLITGGSASGPVSQLWRNNLPLSNAPPSAPGGLGVTVSRTTVTLDWLVPPDDLTPSAGLNYNVRIGTAPGASDMLAPMSLPSGQRLLPALGNAQAGTNAVILLPAGRTYYWSVQALDTSFAGSPFAVEQQFTLGPLLVNPVRFPNGFLEFHFTNQSVLNFDVLVSTNVALPVSSWQNFGPALHLGGGLYRFTDPGAIVQTQRYYLLRQQ